jgi:hypothetical protein
MNHPRGTVRLRMPTSASDDQAGLSWQLAAYAVLVAVAIYYLCIA